MLEELDGAFEKNQKNKVTNKNLKKETLFTMYRLISPRTNQDGP